MKYTKIFLENRLVFEGPEAKNAPPPRGEAPAGTAKSGETIAKEYYAKVDKFIEKQMKEEHPKAQVISEARRAVKEARDKQPGLEAARALQTQLKDILKRGNVTVPDELKQIVPEVRTETPATPATTPAAAPKQKPPLSLAEQMQAAVQGTGGKDATPTKEAPKKIEFHMDGGHELKAGSTEYNAVKVALTKALSEYIKKQTGRELKHNDTLGVTLTDNYSYSVLYDEASNPKIRICKGDKPNLKTNTGGTTEAAPLTDEDLDRLGIDAKKEVKPAPMGVVNWAKEFFIKERKREMQNEEKCSTSDGYIVLRDDSKKGQPYRVFKTK